MMGHRGCATVVVALLILGCCVVSSTSSDDHDEDSDSFLFGSGRLPIPLRVNVVLIGLDNLVLPVTLTSLLESTLPSVIPHCIDTKRQLAVKFELQYSVKRADQGKRDRYEQMLDRAMDRRIGTVRVSEEMIDFFSGLALENVVLEDAGIPAYTIFLVLPRSDQKSAVPYNIAYGNGIPGQTWIGPDRFMVADLAADPAEYGSLLAGEGIGGTFKLKKRTASSQLTDDTAVELVALISSAVRHVVAPDIQFASIPHADKVLVPLIVLNNHGEFNPLSSEVEEHIDVPMIRREVQKMFLPTQEVSIVGGVHSLHEHRHLAMLIAKARRANTLHEMSGGQFHLKMKYYLDSAILLDGIKNADDLLASALLSLTSSHTQVFFNPRLPDVKLSYGKDSISKSQGTWILPVYVFSLKDPEANILFDHHSTMAASPHAVVVLQTTTPQVPVPYFGDGRRMYLTPKFPTREIIAGISKSLGGIVDPAHRFSSLHDRVVHDYTWALGHHPYGYFSNHSQLSTIFTDTILRNLVISRVDSSINVIKEAIREVDEFVDAYLHNPFLESFSHNESNVWRHWIDDLFHKPFLGSISPLAATTVYQLHQEIKKLQEQFDIVGDLLRNYKLEEAYKLAAPLEHTAFAFYEFVRGELHEAESELLCCYLTTDLKQPTSVASYIVIVVVGVLVFLIALWFVTPSKGLLSKLYALGMQSRPKKQRAMNPSRL